MQITKLMDEHYKGLLLTPDIYNSLDLGIHIELGVDIYQLKDDGTLRKYSLRLHEFIWQFDENEVLI